MLHPDMINSLPFIDIFDRIARSAQQINYKSAEIILILIIDISPEKML